MLRSDYDIKLNPTEPFTYTSTESAPDVTFTFSTFSRGDAGFSVNNSIDSWNLEVALAPYTSVTLQGY